MWQTDIFELREQNEFFFFWDQCEINIDIIIEFGVWSDNSSKKNIKSKEDREKLGLAPLPKGRSAPTTPPNESATAYQKIDVCVVFFILYLITYYVMSMKF
jgi:hypothetical protein